MNNPESKPYRRAVLRLARAICQTQRAVAELLADVGEEDGEAAQAEQQPAAPAQAEQPAPADANRDWPSIAEMVARQTVPSKANRDCARAVLAPRSLATGSISDAQLSRRMSKTRLPMAEIVGCRGNRGQGVWPQAGYSG